MADQPARPYERPIDQAAQELHQELRLAIANACRNTEVTQGDFIGLLGDIVGTLVVTLFAGSDEVPAARECFLLNMDRKVGPYMPENQHPAGRA